MNILWVDDEIDLLKPYTIFLADKGYDVETASNGQDAIEMCRENMYDIVFLDENMPGLSGLETLARISEMRPNLPVVMITKSEEENIMDLRRRYVPQGRGGGDGLEPGDGADVRPAPG